MYIRGVIPRNSTELADADPIGRSLFLVLFMAFLIRAQSIFSITSTPSIVQLRRLVDQSISQNVCRYDSRQRLSAVGCDRRIARPMR